MKGYCENHHMLWPCPFCGSEAISEDHDDNGWYIGCSNDDCDLRPSFWGEDKGEAESTWNHRENLNKEWGCVYHVGFKYGGFYFETKEDAEKFQTKCPSWEIKEIPVIKKGVEVCGYE